MTRRVNFRHRVTLRISTPVKKRLIAHSHKSGHHNMSLTARLLLEEALGLRKKVST